ncbi:HD-GYP domain-containing protein [Cohnella suwonensis]|uniref:HD-GYP domain-containing protein n=1 Tax=Cohnella suwonensis TaxID=696072 RepID=A0ABW0M3H3_9BACL
MNRLIRQGCLTDVRIEVDSAALRWLTMLKRKHPDTYEHSVRMALMAGRLSRACLEDPNETVALVAGCLLHDLGKIMIPADLLVSGSTYTNEQWSIVKLHPQLGAELLEIHRMANDEVLGLIRHHHERWDGKGYPSGLNGERIPLLARICSVLESLDSMLFNRSFGNKRTIQDAFCELERKSGSQFDGFIVERLMNRADEIIRLQFLFAHKRGVFL